VKHYLCCDGLPILSTMKKERIAIEQRFVQKVHVGRECLDFPGALRARPGKLNGLMSVWTIGDRNQYSFSLKLDSEFG
jgi:hypothetical protein